MAQLENMANEQEQKEKKSRKQFKTEENVGEDLVVDVDINVNIAGPSWTACRSI
jgi:hypothetical protein